jgi:hypothetical protein
MRVDVTAASRSAIDACGGVNGIGAPPLASLRGRFALCRAKGCFFGIKLAVRPWN